MPSGESPLVSPLEALDETHTRHGTRACIAGGACGALNVFLTGGLSFAIGWHFGWNLTMGHLLGLSTSGIPMSAKLVSVVPHPSKAALHGGRFGPEQSPLAPLTYLLGCGLLVALYGGTGLEVWRERLQPSASLLVDAAVDAASMAASSAAP